MSIEVVTTDRGRQKVILEGFLYAHDRLCTDGREMWRCDRRNDCKARIHTLRGHIIQRVNEHTHPPDLERIDSVRNDFALHKRLKSELDVQEGLLPSRSPTDSASSASPVTPGTMITHAFATTAAESTMAAEFYMDAGKKTLKRKHPSRVVYPQALPVSSFSVETMENKLQTMHDFVKNEVNSEINGFGQGDINAEPAISCSSIETDVPEQEIPNIDEELIFRDPVRFWAGTKKLGAFGDVCNAVQSELNSVMRSFTMLNSNDTKTAENLSEICRILSIEQRINSILENKKQMAIQETDMLNNQIAELKRLAEQRELKQQEIRKKAELFDEVFGRRTPSGSSTKSPSPNMFINSEPGNPADGNT